MAIKISGNTVIDDNNNIINIVDSTISGIQNFSNGSFEVVTAGIGSTGRIRILGSAENPTFEYSYIDGNWFSITVGTASTTDAALGVGQTDGITPFTLRYVLDNRPSGIPIKYLNSSGGYTVLDEDRGYLLHLGTSYSGTITIPNGLYSGHSFTIYHGGSSGDISITCSGTLTLAGIGITGTRSLTQSSVSTFTHLGNNVWIVSGAGIE